MTDVVLAYLAIRRDPSSLEPEHYSYSACIDALHTLQTRRSNTPLMSFGARF